MADAEDEAAVGADTALAAGAEAGLTAEVVAGAEDFAAGAEAGAATLAAGAAGAAPASSINKGLPTKTSAPSLAWVFASTPAEGDLTSTVILSVSIIATI